MTDVALFDDFIGELREVFFALRAVTDRLANHELTAAERGVLGELSRLGGQTVPEMARRRARSRQAMQKVVDRLIEREWVTLETNPNHQRSQLVALTVVGKNVFTALRAKEIAALQSVRLPVSVAELKRTTQTLAELRGFFTAIAGAE